MKRIQDPTPELSELENQILSGDGGDLEIPTRELDAGETREEIRRWLTEGGRRKIQKGPKSEIEWIQRNLCDFLDNAEKACGRSAIIAHYRVSPPNNPAIRYTQDKHRFTRTQNCAMETRFRLVIAACAALREAGRQVDDSTACIDLFRGTELALVVPTMRDPEILLDAGSQLSDAWWAIADGLNRECDLTGWFAHLSDKDRRSVAPLASFLEVDAVVDLGRYAMAVGTNLPRDRGHATDPSFEPVVADFNAVNLPHHIHDLAAAPSVTLFRYRVWSGKGRVEASARSIVRQSVVLTFWREIMLTLLADQNGAIAPFILNRLRASLHKGSGDGAEMPMRYPFLRAFDGDGEPHTPLFLEMDGAQRFIPDEGWPEDGGLQIGASIRTQHAQVWGARPDIISLFLRHHADLDDRPFGPGIERAAGLNEWNETFFPARSLGAVIERATLIADRAAGIGAMLRTDFHRKRAAMSAAAGSTHLPPLPFAFAQAWR